MVISFLICETAYAIVYFIKSKMPSILKHIILLFTKKKLCQLSYDGPVIKHIPISEILKCQENLHLRFEEIQ